jgi:integrase
MENQFKAAAKSCEITDVNFHALRHTFATRCVELGFDIKSLSEILGHASVNITLNRYVHPSMELKQKNMDMLSNLLTAK